MESATPEAAANPTTPLRTVVLASAAGTAFEWYDFFVYGALTSADEGKQVAGRVVGSAGNFVGVLNGSWLDASDIDIPGYALSSAARAGAIADGVDPADFANGALPNSAVESKSLSGGRSWVGDGAFLGGAVRRAENRYGIVAEEEAFIDMKQTRYDVRGGLDLDGPISSLKASGSVVDYEHTEFEGPGEPGTRFTNEGWEARIEAGHAPIGLLEGSVGLQASKRDFAAIGDEALIGPTTTKAAGLFAFETWDAGAWGVEGGLRFDDVDIDSITFGHRGFEAWNASFGAHAHVGEHMFFGVSIARTARAPTDLELFADGPHPARSAHAGKTTPSISPRPSITSTSIISSISRIPARSSRIPRATSQSSSMCRPARNSPASNCRAMRSLAPRSASTGRPTPRPTSCARSWTPAAIFR